MKRESVWDYPRPPRLESESREIRVESGGVEIARTCRALRVLETSHPPVYYIPPEDVRMDLLRPERGQTFCEWKGVASYWSLTESARCAWSYENPTKGFEAIRGYLAFYAGKMDACWVGDERVSPESGKFYGGWVTAEISL